MAEPIYDALDGVLARWTMGGAGAPAMKPWVAMLGDDPAEAELRLLALSGQFLGTMVFAAPGSALTALPDLPTLALPSLPDGLRPLANRVLARDRDPARRRMLLELLASRGHAMHPADWLPAASDEDAPDLYAPWRDWVAGAAGADGRTAALDAESWDEFGPAGRAAALTTLRRHDPAAARVLLEAKMGGEVAEARFRLLDALATGLSDADAAFLQAVHAGDRAPRVKALAQNLLARLGWSGEAAGEDVTELAGFFEIQSKGLLRRTKIVAAKPLKTTAQRNRRFSLLNTVGITPFGAALGLSADDLCTMWPWGDDSQLDAGLAVMIERSASDALLVRLLALLAERGAATVQLMLQFAPRLDPAQRDAAAKLLLAKGARFLDLLPLVGGAGSINGMIGAPAGAALLAGLVRKDEEAPRPADLAEELHALGLIASPAAAREAIARLTAIGILAADPRLDMLRLNAALDHGVTG
ncbi:DUF5691 domain-containing protein [Sphingomonas sanxanigenens]|uniref:Uncharacterized protein n=1 Tax=Sphingomonas sanxanigenens DSM 19645 = NX02 TaxID=1123269 RepID=W0ADL7_9SPHN|nr:DUF5691 domain-containing protein [Sphingomonas sanxanigenens]AHE53780.1 hypothetical protein NX02_10315 [Sphingomonas sanxanigenens DSM 19645 = NX02]